MKIHSSSFPHASCLAVAITALSIIASRADSYVQLDFDNTGNVVPTGWVGLTGNFLADTPTASISNISGLGYNFSIDNVGVYDNGNALEPLTRSGFYTFGNNANDHNFSFSGLTAGETVALYACAAWDGNGRGGVIVYGNSGPSGVQAQTLGDPGTSPTLANLTLIGSAIADGTGTVQGSLNGAGGVGSATEGQAGGFVFDIQAVPEPSIYALFGVGGLALNFLRRKKAVLDL
jgi:hypothetical protein